ncbi:unnamed protein product, partial [Symbiodinium pilosum]
ALFLGFLLVAVWASLRWGTSSGFRLTAFTKATSTTPAAPAKSIASPKIPPKEKGKATAGAGGDPRPFIEVDREGLKFKTYDCDNCNTVVFVGQHVLQQEAPQDGKLLLGQQRFADLTASDIRPTKDVTGKLPKSPEAATLERARNHLVRAKEKGFQTIEERYDKDPVFAANMLEDGQTIANIRIWGCLTHAVISASQRSAAQRALNLGASQTPMDEAVEEYPARTVFMYGFPLRAANLITDAADPDVCIGFGGTFFSIKNFAE